ncbi:type VII secretion target [Mycolicibacillus trivialis]|uniref:ESX-1 secretion-associated protein n=1 Tax=Mycolicibacillus trivialis TaxID=1798 RepID=A0A1X2EH53_9MYCO|nr:type VII secretion target [Mycolicibacillus trivialis]ORX02113.1 hypothetical protein AWC30_12950 [Mycolicibacillus trivialis]
MAEPPIDTGVRFYTAAVRGVADRFAAHGQALAAAAHRHRTGLSFDGSRAGRAHGADGDALRTELDRLGASLHRWSRAVNEIALTLRATADRYTDAESRCAARLG